MPMPRYIGIGISIAEVPQKESLLADVSHPLFPDYEFSEVAHVLYFYKCPIFLKIVSYSSRSKKTYTFFKRL